MSVPAVSVRTNEATSWQQPAIRKIRETCPISRCDDVFDLSDFQLFLKSNTKMRDERSRDYCVLGLERFFYMVDVAKGSDVAGFVVALREQNIMAQLAELPVMDVQYTWARQIYESVQVFARYAAALCGRRRHQEAKLAVQAFLDDDMVHLVKRCTAQRKMQNCEKRIVDSERIAALPPVDVIHEQVRRAMAVIWVIRNYCIDEGLLLDMPRALKLEATTAMIGVLFFNSFAGRCGEWESMETAHVLDHMSKRKSYVLCPRHKTSYAYGSLAKFIPASTWESLRLFLDMPGRKTNLLLDPVGNSEKTSIPPLLKRFGVNAFNTDSPPTSTILRKAFHTILLQHSTKDTMSLMTRIDGHSEQTARKVYGIVTPEHDAELASILYQQAFKAHVDFPTPEMIKNMGITIDSLFKKGDELTSLVSDEIEEDEDVFQIVAVENDSFEAAPGFVPVVMPVLSDLIRLPAPPSVPATPSGEPGATAASPRSSGKKYLKDFDEKYLEAQSPRTSYGVLIVPTKDIIEKMLEDGVAIGALSPDLTYEGVRSHLRKTAKVEADEYEQKMHREQQQKAKGEKKKQKKQNKADKTDT